MRYQLTTHLNVETALAIHEMTLEKFGGASGIRDLSLLEAAVMQPQMTFDGQDLYATIEEKAARYAFGIIKNHPFIDGNKRTGAALMLTFLALNNKPIKPKHGAISEVILGVASDELSFNDLVEFIRHEMTLDNKIG